MLYVPREKAIATGWLLGLQHLARELKIRTLKGNLIRGHPTNPYEESGVVL
jgi:hypothetical protein